jgi:hypothetical protein
MQSTSEKSGKRLYTVPRLTMHGTLEQLTKVTEKTFGVTDGYVFQGQGLATVS